ncbi:polysaccharide biosynthesis/export family protein [Flavobacterium urumqiense]|uniref:Polysaccharide export outer membrane protein n=1 Tax=Flavobacterium urumqiense TaxID=935224 RepID=A0A1H5Y3W3_9FLAO|nr:polysaccharide biosynthesis/export family protein [Flavobacterium urumqiense]SEG18377.1 polysaccharide export outer membrane protein [Flavobacterium urumqiense]
MKYISLLQKTIALFLLLLLFSCASKKDVVYYQNIDSLTPAEKSTSYEIRIQPDDLLIITVSAEEAEVAMPFNLGSTSGSKAAAGPQTVQSYLVDSKGNIDFPILGQLKISGLTRSEVLRLLQDKIAVYVKNPIINLRILNFKVSVQGEVNSPGTYAVASDRITLIEALTMAKDLSIFGKRNNILIIREIDGVKSYNRVDITKADFIQSPFYYMAQNDVIYVEPNKTKIGSSTVGANTGLIFSITSILITVISLIIATTK